MKSIINGLRLLLILAVPTQGLLPAFAMASHHEHQPAVEHQQQAQQGQTAEVHKEGCGCECCENCNCEENCGCCSGGECTCENCSCCGEGGCSTGTCSEGCCGEQGCSTGSCCEGGSCGECGSGTCKPKP